MGFNSDDELKQIVLLIKMTEASLIAKSDATDGGLRKELLLHTQTLEENMTQRFDAVDQKLEQV